MEDSSNKSPSGSDDKEEKNSNNSPQKSQRSVSRNQSRSRSRDQQHSPKQQPQRKIVPFDLFLEKDIISLFGNTLQEVLDPIIEESDVQSLVLEKDFLIPEIPGKLIKIQDEQLNKKAKAAELILKDIHNKLLDKQPDYKKEGSQFSVMLLIPEALVSFLIGRKGAQINQLMSQSKSQIVVNQPIAGMSQRTVSVKGKNHHIAQAIQLIYDLIEQRAPIVLEDIQKPAQEVNFKKILVKAKFIFSNNLTEYLMSKGQAAIKKLEDKLGIKIKFVTDKELDFIQRDEYICIIKGKIDDVQSCMIYILRQVNSYYINERNKPDYLVKLLIPNNYVTKLIGKNGCLIRDIAKKSGGAQIKILSDKQQEKEYSECLIQIAGTLANKQDASCLIVEKIEQFRTGGPILLSGKNINDDIVAQYKNSTFNTSPKIEQFRKFSNGLKSSSRHNSGRSYSNNRSRSRSRSKLKERKESSKFDKRSREKESQKYEIRRSSREKRRTKIEDEILKIPVHLSYEVYQILKENDQKIIKQIKRETGASISLDKWESKEKRAFIKGKIDENTKAFVISMVDRKANTTSSLYISSTISNPNIKSIIKAVSTILHSQMIEDQNAQKEIPNNADLLFFSEEKYIDEKPEEFDESRKALLRETPSVENIYEFIKALYDCAQFSPECCIICLIYVNRMISFNSMPLKPTNWRPLILCSLLVAQKVWDDRYLSNADFAYIYPFFVTDEINKLESKFLELMQYNVIVKSQLYAKYYFELRALFKNQEEFPLTALDTQTATSMENRSETLQKNLGEKKEKLSNTTGGQYSKKVNVVIN